MLRFSEMDEQLDIQAEPVKTFAFIDASNLFYGGQKSLGWSIDYEKLRDYLTEKYGVSRIYYFGGVETYDFPYDYLENESVPINPLHLYLEELIKKVLKCPEELRYSLFKPILDHLSKDIQRAKFYKKLAGFGYYLVLKPVKTYYDEQGKPQKKANCDVDMTYYLMLHEDEIERNVVLSGDGDFLPVLKHLRSVGKEMIILARAPRTAKEIKQFAGDEFRDFEYLRESISMETRK